MTVPRTMTTLVLFACGFCLLANDGSAAEPEKKEQQTAEQLFQSDLRFVSDMYSMAIIVRPRLLLANEEFKKSGQLEAMKKTAPYRMFQQQFTLDPEKIEHLFVLFPIETRDDGPQVIHIFVRTTDDLKMEPIVNSLMTDVTIKTKMYEGYEISVAIEKNTLAFRTSWHQPDSKSVIVTYAPLIKPVLDAAQKPTSKLRTLMKGRLSNAHMALVADDTGVTEVISAIFASTVEGISGDDLDTIQGIVGGLRFLGGPHLTAAVDCKDAASATRVRKAFEKQVTAIAKSLPEGALKPADPNPNVMIARYARALLDGIEWSQQKGTVKATSTVKPEAAMKELPLTILKSMVPQ